MVRARRTVALLSIAALLSLSAPGDAARTPDGPNVHTLAGTFGPPSGERPAQPAQSGARDHWIVRFAGPVEDAWKAQAEAAGAELLSYLPDFAFKARMTAQQAQAVEALGVVASVERFPEALKLSPRLAAAGEGLFRVRIERGADAPAVAAAIARLGASVGVVRDVAIVQADARLLAAIARVTDVAWIEPYRLHTKHNDAGAGQIVGTNAANARGYDGGTQIAAVADTGIGDGTAAGAHPDIPASRVVAIHNWPGSAGGCFSQVINDGAKDVDSGHGTHVAGSVLSDGGTAGEGKGGAPAARLVFQAIENYAITSGFCKSFYGYQDGYYLTGIPSDLNLLFQQAYDAGARVHANSWGSDAAGDYTVDSANADKFVWDRKDMTITFSAGNAGKDANGDGVVDADSTGSPATAKNVITIGASENERASYPCDPALTYVSHDAYQSGQTCASMGGSNHLGTWGQRYGSSFPAEPLKSDLTAGNREQMAAWSSRGPTDDGRQKPDVVAPGTWILSGFSGLHQEGYGDPTNPQNGAYQWDGWGMPANGAYKWMGGTSMSNPVAAGGAVLVRDFYQRAHSHNASAALVKGTLINTAVDMLDENNDGQNDNDFPVPNIHEGWGRIDLDNATDGGHRWVDRAAGLSTNGTVAYTTAVTGGGALKVTLVWSDYPSTETASINLVNDLDLVLKAPDGTTYLGNVFSGGWSATGGSADRRNNVENAYVRSAAGGTWTIEVKGYNVPNGPQPFALVVDGSGSLTETAPPPPPPAAALHVGDLDATRAKSGSGWRMTVTIRVHDQAEANIASATVSGTFRGSNGFTQNVSCSTSSSGTCSIQSNRISNSNATATFTVNNVTKSGYTYDATKNHDPESDSNGTSITIAKP